MDSDTPAILIRPARATDGARICALYNHHVTDTIVTFDETPLDAREMARRCSGSREHDRLPPPSPPGEKLREQRDLGIAGLRDPPAERRERRKVVGMNGHRSRLEQDRKEWGLLSAGVAVGKQAPELSRAETPSLARGLPGQLEERLVTVQALTEGRHARSEAREQEHPEQPSRGPRPPQATWRVRAQSVDNPAPGG